MEKVYKSVVEGGLMGMSFPDLYIDIGGVKKVIVVKKGEYIPTARIDSGVLSTSLAIGCLGRALKKGWVVEENYQQIEPVEEIFTTIGQVGDGIYGPIELKRVPKPIQVDKVETPKEEETFYCTNCNKKHLVNTIIGKKHLEYKQVAKLSEVKEDKAQAGFKLVIKDKQEKPITETATADKVDSYADFEKLMYFEKLKFIKQSDKMDIIEEILEKSDKKQLKNNAQLRLLNRKD